MHAIRPWLTRLHRWTGLALAAFLLVVGFTGALLPFQRDIEHWLAPTPPDQIVSAPQPSARPLDWATLGAIAERRTDGLIGELPLHREPGQPATFPVAARPGQPAFAFNTISLNPYSGEELSRHRVGDNGPLLAQVMPFLYSLHISLALGEWGSWLLGVAALAWTLDCFVGFYLTLPAGPRGWWRNWLRAWRMRLPPRSAFRFNFDLHRAAGLWLWPMLFVFAWSSVGLNLHAVYRPVMQLFFDYPAGEAQTPVKANSARPMPWDEMLPAARRAVAAEGQKRGFTVVRERALWIDRDSGNYTYVVRTSRDLSTDGANSYFGVDGRTGKITSVDLPSGEHAGATISYWLDILHTTGIFGLPYRIFVSVLGAAVMALSITGVLLWLKKRSARLLSRRREPRDASPASGGATPPDVRDSVHQGSRSTLSGRFERSGNPL